MFLSRLQNVPHLITGLQCTDLQGLGDKQSSSIKCWCPRAGLLVRKCPQDIGQALRTVLPNPLSQVTSYCLHCQQSESDAMCTVCYIVQAAMWHYSMSGIE